jgi:hypothetical protein
MLVKPWPRWLYYEVLCGELFAGDEFGSGALQFAKSDADWLLTSYYPSIPSEIPHSP